MKKNKFFNIQNLLKNYKIQLLVTFLLTVLVTINKIGLSIRSKVYIHSTLDFSWQTDLIERFLHGFVAGKDFIFTYGPLYQLFYSLPSRFFKISSVSSIVFSPLVSVIILFFILSLIACFIVKKDKIGIFVFYILFVIGIISSNLTDMIRICLPLLYAVIIGFLYSNKKWKGLFLSAILPSIFGLFSYDIFLYCLLFSVSYSLYSICFNHKKNTVINFIINIIFLFLFQFFISFAISGNLDYTKYSIDTVIEYSAVMGIPWSFSMNYLLLFPLSLFGFFVYLLVTKRYLKMDILIAILISSLVQMIAFLTRSDSGHILMGIYPSIIVISVFLFKYAIKENVYIFIFMLMFFMLPNKFSLGEIRLDNYKYFYRAIRDKYSFDSIYELPKNFYFNINDINNINLLITKNKNQVWIYPYDNFLLNINGSTFNSFMLQSYGYSDSISEMKTVELFKTNPPKIIILGIDDITAARIDGMPNFTRNPLIAKWMLENYSVLEKYKNFLILEFKPEKLCIKKLNDCGVFDLEFINNFSQLNKPFYKLIKKPSYNISFEKQKNIKIPMNGFKKENKLLILDNYSNIDEIEGLFSQCNNFNNYNKNENILVAFTASIFNNNTINIGIIDLKKKCY